MKIKQHTKLSKIAGFIILVAAIVSVPGTVSIFLFESIKPTANYLEKSSSIAFVASMVTLISVAAVMIFPRISDEYEFDTNKGKIKQWFIVFILPIVFMFSTYQTVSFGIPMMLHSISAHETVQIEFLIAEKDYDTTRGARRGWTCRYKLRFEHPDIPERNYLCATKSFWEQVEENSVLTVSAQKSRVAYYIPKLR